MDTTRPVIKSYSLYDLRSMRYKSGLSLSDVAIYFGMKKNTSIIGHWEYGTTRIPDKYHDKLLELYSTPKYGSVIDYAISRYNEEESDISLQQLKIQVDLFMQERGITGLELSRDLIRLWLKHFIDVKLTNDIDIVFNYLSVHKEVEISDMVKHLDIPHNIVSNALSQLRRKGKAENLMVTIDGCAGVWVLCEEADKHANDKSKAA